jgi:hypothetical protein
MTHVGKKRKRYLLLSCSGEATEEIRAGIARFAKERYKGIGEKAVIIVPKGVIIRTDNAQIDRLRTDFGRFDLGGLTLRARSVSGSISKLKRLADG